MAARKPLVIINGQIQQLPAGDSLNASANEVDIVSLSNANAGALAIGQVVYVSATGACDKSRANASGTAKAFGLVRDTSIAPAASGTIQTDGVLVATTPQWDAVTGQTGGLTPGAVYYLSASTAGNITTTPPSGTGEFVLKIGIAISATDFEITFGDSVLL